MLSDELKAIPAQEYIEHLNREISVTDRSPGCGPVAFEVSGVGLERQTVLHIPRTALGLTTEAIYKLRQKGILCYPVLAPLDLHELV